MRKNRYVVLQLNVMVPKWMHYALANIADGINLSGKGEIVRFATITIKNLI
jgi:hypothetical protein